MFSLAWPETEFPITKRECSCSFCQKHGASYTSHPDSQLNIQVRDENELLRYRFGHRTADFIICRCCGGLMFALCTLDGNCYAVTNVNHFENVSADALIDSKTNFENESIDSRLARRKRVWTPSVKFGEIT